MVKTKYSMTRRAIPCLHDTSTSFFFQNDDSDPVQTVRKRRWIGHMHRKPKDCVTRQVLSWNPQGRRKWGCQKLNWKRSVGKLGGTGLKITRLAQESTEWQGLWIPYAPRRYRSKKVKTVMRFRTRKNLC